jgi:copper chaperone CopZ
MTSTAQHTAACGHASDVPAQLCAHCANRLREQLGRLPGLYTALEAWLAPGARRPEYASTSSVEAPLPVREAVLDLRGPGGIVGVLEDWREAVHDARGFTAPSRAGSIPQRIEAAVQALHVNLTWVSLAWDQADAFATEIRRLEARGLAVIEPPERSTPIGACPTDLGDGTICGTTIRVPAGTHNVHCRGCGTHFPPETWLNLARWIRHDQTAA